MYSTTLAKAAQEGHISIWQKLGAAINSQTSIIRHTTDSVDGLSRKIPDGLRP